MEFFFGKLQKYHPANMKHKNLDWCYQKKNELIFRTVND
jgi:hypothetical protein